MSENNNQLQEACWLPQEIEGTLLLKLSDTRQERLDTLFTEYQNFSAPYTARDQQVRAQAEQSGDRIALERSDELLNALKACRQRIVNLKNEVLIEGKKVSESVVNQIATLEEHFSVLRTLLSELDGVTKDQATVTQADQQHNAEIVNKRKIVFPGWVRRMTVQSAFFTHLQKAQRSLELGQTPGHIPIEQRARKAGETLLNKINPSPNGDRDSRTVAIESADEAQALTVVCDEVLSRITMAQARLNASGKQADPRMEKQYAEVRALREQLTQVERTFNSPLLDTFGIIDEIEGRIDQKLSEEKQSLSKEIQSRLSAITRAISGFNFDHGWIDARVGGLNRKSAVLWLDGNDYSNEFNKAYPPGGLRAAYEFSLLPGQDEPIALNVWRNAFMIDENKWLEFRAKINAKMSGQVSIDAQRQDVGERAQRAARATVPDFAEAHGDIIEPAPMPSRQAPRHAVAEPAPTATQARESDPLAGWLDDVAQSPLEPTPDDGPLAGWLDDVAQSPPPRLADPPKHSRPTPVQPAPRQAPEPVPPDAEEISFHPLFETLTPEVREAGRRHREALATPSAPSKPLPEPIRVEPRRSGVNDPFAPDSKRKRSQFFTPPPGDLQDPDIPELLKRVEKLERTQGAGAKLDEVNKPFEKPAATAGDASDGAPNPDELHDFQAHAHEPEKPGEHDAHAHAEPHDDHNDSSAPKLTRAQQIARDLLGGKGKRTTHSDSAETSAAPKSPPEIIRNPLAPRSAPKAAAAPARTAPVNAADAPAKTQNELKYGTSREFSEGNLMYSVLNLGGMYLRVNESSGEYLTVSKDIQDYRARKKLEVKDLIGNNVFEQMKKEGIFELIALRPSVAVTISEETEMVRKGGFLGIGAKEVPTEVSKVLTHRNKQHKDIFNDNHTYQGVEEPAYSIFYCVTHPDYKDSKGKKNTELMVELILPESKARELYTALQKDPYFIRELLDNELIRTGVLSVTQPELGDNGGPRWKWHSARYKSGPPYEQIARKGPTKMYMSPDTDDSAYKPKLEIKKENIREI